MSQLTQVSSSKCFRGFQKVFNHFSEELQCKMNFAIYQPPQATETNKVPVIYWLSGLTCTEQNFIIKSGFQRYASELGICVVAPDTSPRECGIEGEEDNWDHGTGAGFYVDATVEKWAKHYRMYSYVTRELIKVVEDNFPYVQKNNRAISGHSMGGHGGLICALKNPGLYKVATAFAPIANPMNTPVGKKNFSAYLGENSEAWKEYDSTHLVGKYSGPPLHVVVDQGTEDTFMKDGELLPQTLVDACEKAKFPLKFRSQEGYDHGYFFVGTFIEDHFKHMLNIMKQ